MIAWANYYYATDCPICVGYTEKGCDGHSWYENPVAMATLESHDAGMHMACERDCEGDDDRP